MKELRSEIEIEAPAERVWQVLTDFAAYPEWNPFIRRVSGRPEIEERLVVRMQPSGTRGMTFRPTVTKVEPNRQLRWLGHLLVLGIFDGEHIFEIEEFERARVRTSPVRIPDVPSQLARSIEKGSKLDVRPI